MKKETVKTLKELLLRCVKKDMHRLIESEKVEKLQIQIQDRQDPTQRATYQFETYQDKFVEQTGMSNFKPVYDPEEFVEAIERFNYLVSVKVV